MRILIIILLFCAVACKPKSNLIRLRSKTIEFKSRHHKPMSKIFKTHFIYPRVTYRTRFDTEEIWLATGENKQLFINFINDKRVNVDFRLVVYWVLYRKFGKDANSFFDIKMLSKLFYNAFLKETYYEHWSFHRDFSKSYEVTYRGEFVDMLVEFGDVSIPLWYQMLDNERRIIPNCLSTIGCARYNAEISSYRYHYNDYAAFYLSLITKIPLPFHEEYSERAKEIAIFKTKIQAYCAERGIKLE